MRSPAVFTLSLISTVELQEFQVSDHSSKFKFARSVHTEVKPTTSYWGRAAFSRLSSRTLELLVSAPRGASPGQEGVQLALGDFRALPQGALRSVCSNGGYWDQECGKDLEMGLDPLPPWDIPEASC